MLDKQRRVLNLLARIEGPYTVQDASDIADGYGYNPAYFDCITDGDKDKWFVLPLMQGDDIYEADEAMAQRLRREGLL